jgi:hypothetical protein
MMTPEQLIEKAIIQTSDMDGSGEGGLLQPEIADKFIDFVIDQSVMKNNARMEKIAPDQKYIDKVSVGSRVAEAHTQATTTTTRRGITTERVTITCKQIDVPWEISQETLARNIEGESFEDHVAAMMSKQLSNDLEELFIKGDTDSTDTYLALADGWAKLASSGGHVFDAGRVSIATVANAKTVFGGMLRAMPTKFIRDLTSLRFFCGIKVYYDYIDALSERATALGDKALVERLKLTPYSVELVPVPTIPTNLSYSSPTYSNNSYIILTHYANLIAAFEVQYAGSKSGISLLKDRDIYANTRQYCMHLSAGCQIQEDDAVVYAENVKSES